VSVRQGNWKLIRRFEPHPDYPAVRELYNLQDDIGEKTNLAETMPDKVSELDALIDAFIDDTGALAPKPNPAYVKPDPAAGLVPKMCRITLIDGALRVQADGRTPFLGTAQVRHTGSTTLKLRARSAAGGTGKVQWKTADQESFPATGQIVEFNLPAGDTWQDVTVNLPVAGKLAIVRLYVPARQAPVEIESIEFAGDDNRPKIWNFGETRPSLP
jgi:hypothetical protein